MFVILNQLHLLTFTTLIRESIFIGSIILHTNADIIWYNMLYVVWLFNLNSKLPNNFHVVLKVLLFFQFVIFPAFVWFCFYKVEKQNQWKHFSIVIFCDFKFFFIFFIRSITDMRCKWYKHGEQSNWKIKKLKFMRTECYQS